MVTKSTPGVVHQPRYRHCTQGCSLGGSGNVLIDHVVCERQRRLRICASRTGKLAASLLRCTQVGAWHAQATPQLRIDYLGHLGMFSLGQNIARVRGRAFVFIYHAQCRSSVL